MYAAKYLSTRFGKATKSDIVQVEKIIKSTGLLKKVKVKRKKLKKRNATI